MQCASDHISGPMVPFGGFSKYVTLIVVKKDPVEFVVPTASTGCPKYPDTVRAGVRIHS